MRFTTLSIWLVLFIPTFLRAGSLYPLNSGGSVFSLDSGRYRGVDYNMYRTDSGWAIELRGNNRSRDDALRELVTKARNGEVDFLITFDFTPDPGLHCDGNEFDLLLNGDDDVEIDDVGILIFTDGAPKWHGYNFSRLKVFIDEHDISDSRCVEI